MKISAFKNRCTLLATLILSVPILAHAAIPVPITAADCGADLNQNNTVYELVEDLTCDSTASAPATQALLLSANNSQLLLNKHFIRFEFSEPGGDVDLDGIVIEGNNNIVEGPGVVNLFNNNIRIIDATNNRIKGLTIKSSEIDGVSLENASDNRVYNNKIINSDGRGVHLSNSNTNIIADNFIFRTDSGGIRLDVTDATMTTSGNLITNNLIDIVSGDGIELRNSENDERLLNDNIITYNNIRGTASDGIFVIDGDRNTISHNRTRYTDEEGIRIADSDDNIIEHNNIANTLAFAGIRIDDGNGNTVKYNTIANTEEEGIDLVDNSSNNTISHNHITSSRLSGIGLQGEGGAVINDNKITNNHIHNSGQSGILLSAEENDTINNNTITGNYISASNRQAISLLDEDEAAGNNQIEGNTIDNNKVKHDLNASAAFSECTKPADVNTWGTNEVNKVPVSGTPDCELT